MSLTCLSAEAGLKASSMMKWKWFSTSNLNECDSSQTYDLSNNNNNDKVVYRTQGSPPIKNRNRQFPLVHYLALPGTTRPNSVYDSERGGGQQDTSLLGLQAEIGDFSPEVSGPNAYSISSAEDNDSRAEESMSVSSASSATDSTYSEGQGRRRYAKRESPVTRLKARLRGSPTGRSHSPEVEVTAKSYSRYLAGLAAGQGQVTVIPPADYADESRALAARDRGRGQPPPHTQFGSGDGGAVGAVTQGGRGWVYDTAARPSRTHTAYSQSQAAREGRVTAIVSSHSAGADPDNVATSSSTPVLMRHTVTTWSHRDRPPSASMVPDLGGRSGTVAARVPNGTFYIEPAPPAHRKGQHYEDPRNPRMNTASLQQQSNLLRSRSFSTSMPSLLSRSKEDKKREKEEKKREKEEKKRIKEEEKRREKEEKKRQKEEKKFKTNQTLPRNWNVVARPPVQQVHTAPRLYAVPIDFEDKPSAVSSKDSNFILQARPHSSAPDIQRLEKEYGSNISQNSSSESDPSRSVW